MRLYHTDPLALPEPDPTETESPRSLRPILPKWPTSIIMEFHVRKQYRDHIGTILGIAISEIEQEDPPAPAQHDVGTEGLGQKGDDPPFKGKGRRISGQRHTKSLANTTITAEMITLVETYLLSTQLWRTSLLYQIIERINHLVDLFGRPACFGHEKAAAESGLLGWNDTDTTREPSPTATREVKVFSDVLALFERVTEATDSLFMRLETSARAGDAEGRYRANRLLRVAMGSGAGGGIQDDGTPSRGG